MKVNAWIWAPATDRDLESGFSKNISVRTRKMVNYGQSHGKLWWRLVAILTCKSVVIPGFWGEGQTEPSSRCFPPKFSSVQQELNSFIRKSE